MRRQKHQAAKRKAFQGMSAVQCFDPDKVSYPSLWRARGAARAQGMRAYPCGDHYHLTSKKAV